jgi:hypothetical protein
LPSPVPVPYKDRSLTLNAVYLLKSRLLRRLRAEFADCVDL